MRAKRGVGSLGRIRWRAKTTETKVRRSVPCPRRPRTESSPDDSSRHQPGSRRGLMGVSDRTPRRDLTGPTRPAGLRGECPPASACGECLLLDFRSGDNTAELQSQTRNYFAVFCLKNNNKTESTT